MAVDGVTTPLEAGITLGRLLFNRSVIEKGDTKSNETHACLPVGAYENTLSTRVARQRREVNVLQQRRSQRVVGATF